MCVTSVRWSIDDAIARSLFMSSVLHYIFVPVGLHDTKREFVCQYKVALRDKLMLQRPLRVQAVRFSGLVLVEARGFFVIGSSEVQSVCF